MIKIIKYQHFFKDLEAGEHSVVSSLIDKLVELWYRSLFTLLVVKVLTEQNKYHVALTFWPVEFERPGEINKFDSTSNGNSIFKKTCKCYGKSMSPTGG